MFSERMLYSRLDRRPGKRMSVLQDRLKDMPPLTGLGHFLIHPTHSLRSREWIEIRVQMLCCEVVFLPRHHSEPHNRNRRIGSSTSEDLGQTWFFRPPASRLRMLEKLS
jgi:hypothetical protein